jgi:hypothetical protein
VVAATTYQVLHRTAPGRGEAWRRTNYRGATPSLLAGPAVAVGAAAGIARSAGSAAALTLACGALGLYDDLAGDSHARGLRGHAASLRAGRVTTGMVKLVGLASIGAASSLARHRTGTSGVGTLLVDAMLVAGTANLVNLFDLRPGRALKVVVLAAAPLAAGGSLAGASAAGAAAGAAVAVLAADLREDTMIGDCGANALGALLGWSLAAGLGRRARFSAGVAVAGLTLASERISFTDVIARTPWLAAADAVGRRP